ncbi:Hpt domain-containing protein [Terrabacter sp. GCM10028922]|uniref:Hpt domain-containing protein n=1 Tax=Terrabacter sp. GCM10028922 TaxID=3273428 RepID=UPI003620DA8B
MTSSGPSSGPRSDDGVASDGASSARERLQAIYDRARASFTENLETIETAVSRLTAGALDETGRDAAERAAHRLAGAAGTVGLPDATAPARQLEHAFAEHPGPDRAEVLQEHASRLRRILSAGSAPSVDEDEL